MGYARLLVGLLPLGSLGDKKIRWIQGDRVNQGIGTRVMVARSLSLSPFPNKRGCSVTQYYAVSNR